MHIPQGFTDLTAFPGIGELWAETLGNHRICIAVLDGPADLTHPSLAGADITQVDVLSRAGAAESVASRHGTHIASILFGQHDGPIPGIAPLCRGLIIPIYGGSESEPACSQAELARAIREAVRLGADVINISGGELSHDGEASPDLADAILDCVANRRLVVAAAGNEGCEQCLHVPGALPAVLAVGAMDEQGEPLQFSNWGGRYRMQGILAPGANIPGASPGGGVTTQSGTSFATPVVSGIAGLLLSLQLKRGDRPAPLLVRQVILASALGCGQGAVSTCDRLLAGRLNVLGARNLLYQGVTPMADSLDAQGSSALPPSPSEPSGGEQFDTVRQVSHAAGMSANYGRTTPIPERSAPSPWDAHDAEPLAPRAVVPAGCGCGGKSGVRQFVYAIGELGIDFGIRQRQDSLQEHFLGVVPSPDDRVPGPQGPRPHPAYPSDIGTYYNFLRYLLGYNFPARDPAGQPYTEAGNFISNGSLYDAASVYWVLKQGECPLYVIRPQGAFAEQAYKQLTVFLIEQLGLTRQDLLDLGIHTGCLEGFLKCYGGLQRDIFDPTPPSPPPLKPAPQAGHPKRREGRRREGAESAEAESAEAERTEELEAAEFTAMVDTGPAGHPFGPVDPLDIFGEDPRKASHIAIAGEVVGRVRLYTGEEVEVLDPALRGMSNWNTPQLILDILKYLGLIDPAATTLPPAPNQDQAYIIFLIVKVIAKLYDLVLNPGKDPADRARNYFATTQLMFAARTFMNPYFLSMLGATRVNFPTATPPPVPSQTFQADPEKLQNIVVDTLLAKSARCLRYGSMPFDVELSFYNFTNQFQGTVALAQTIDVSDIVPVASSKIRAYPVRR